MEPSKLLTIEKSYHGSLEDQDTFDVPHEIGYYSVDAEKLIRFDRSLMKYYVPRVNNRNLRLDLNVGYENTIKEPYDSLHKHLYNLYHWIRHSKYSSLNGIDFVTTRGTIQKLLCTPFCSEEFYHWDICASRVGDVIYFVGVQTDKTLEKELNMTAEEKRMSSWGFKFEEYMTADVPRGTPDTTSTTHEIEKYCTVIKNKLGNFNLLIVAEVDCIESSKSYRIRKGDPSCYVELKTSFFKSDFRSRYIFKRYKSLQWWAQSAIVGIEDIVCGLRDENGIVLFVSSFKTRELPFMCGNLWSPDVCFNFCNNFLRYLKEKIPDNHRIVYKFEYAGGSKVSVTAIQDPDDDRFKVLPDWYLADLLKKFSKRKQSDLSSHSS